MKEIEVKAKVYDPALLLKNLKNLGADFSGPTIQVDSIYVKDKNVFLDFKPETNFLRIREQNGKTVFTLKRSVINELDKIEKELEIKDKKVMAEILELMDYHEAVKIIKIRRKCYLNNYEICLDKVEDLGSFVEVESLVKDGNSLKIQSEMFEFLETLGVNKSDQVFEGYDTMIFKQNIVPPLG